MLFSFCTNKRKSSKAHEMENTPNNSKVSAVCTVCTANNVRKNVHYKSLFVRFIDLFFASTFRLSFRSFVVLIFILFVIFLVPCKTAATLSSWSSIESWSRHNFRLSHYNHPVFVLFWLVLFFEFLSVAYCLSVVNYNLQAPFVRPHDFMVG